MPNINLASHPGVTVNMVANPLMHNWNPAVNNFSVHPKNDYLITDEKEEAMRRRNRIGEETPGNKEVHFEKESHDFENLGGEEDIITKLDDVVI